jgi:hypothetical protein
MPGTRGADTQWHAHVSELNPAGIGTAQQTPGPQPAELRIEQAPSQYQVKLSEEQSNLMEIDSPGI